MKLFELFSKAGDWEWEEQGRSAGSAVFAIGDVFYRTLVRGFLPPDQPGDGQEEFLDIAFEALRFDAAEDEEASFDDVSSDGNQFQVFSTVFDIVKDWFSRHGVLPIFANASEKRARIYMAVLKRNGWRVEMNGSGDDCRIFGYPPGYQPKS